MTTEHIVYCDGCDKQLLPVEHVTRIVIQKDVNNAREEAQGMWMWERPMIKASDPPGADSFYSKTLHYCEACRPKYQGFMPIGFEEDCP